MSRLIQIAAAATVAAVLAGATPSTAQAAGYHVDQTATTVNFPEWDRLNIRKWPASHSRKVGSVRRHRTVYVSRCIIKSGADWCFIRSGYDQGWVNGRYIARGGATFATPHHEAYDWH